MYDQACMYAVIPFQDIRSVCKSTFMLPHSVEAAHTAQYVCKSSFMLPLSVSVHTAYKSHQKLMHVQYMSPYRIMHALNLDSGYRKAYSSVPLLVEARFARIATTADGAHGQIMCDYAHPINSTCHSCA
eukprot:jgi/Botrbrau1/16016/Bobra.0353s0011.1